MKKIKLFTFSALSMLLCMLAVVSAFAESRGSVDLKECRTVFPTDEEQSGIWAYYYITDNPLNIKNVPYIQVVFAVQATAPIGSKSTIKGNQGVFVTVEQTDRYTGANTYYTIWHGSKKLRISGRDEQLTYPAYVYDSVYGSDCGQYAGIPVSMISVEDFKRIYGYDQSYWAEKNTYYFNRNGKGLLKKTQVAAPKTSAKTTTPAKTQASSSNIVPNFTAVTGVKASGSTVYGTEYRNVTQSQLAAYLHALQGKGFSLARDLPIKNDVVYNYNEIMTLQRTGNGSSYIVSVAVSGPVYGVYKVSVNGYGVENVSNGKSLLDANNEIYGR